jgi:hypothetical protein
LSRRTEAGREPRDQFVGPGGRGQDPGEVLSALLQNTIDALASLDAKTREEVEVQYIKTLVYITASPGERFGPAKVFDIASRRQTPGATDNNKR